MYSILERVDWRKLLRNRLVVGSLITLAAMLVGWLLSNLTAFENLDLKAYDTAFRFRGVQDMSESDIVLVTIDDQTFASLPGWPYPRSYFAQAIVNLADAGARLIVVDVEFTEDDQEDPRRDKVLAAAVLRAGNVILAGKWVREIAWGGTENTYLAKPIKPLLNTGSRWGLVNVLEDSDGFIRRYLVSLPMAEDAHHPLALEAYLSLRGLTDGRTPRATDDRLRVGDAEIPLQGRQSFLINYRGPAQTFPTYHFSTILDDSRFSLPNPEEDTDIFDLHREWGTFRDKVVFIGAAAEELQDNKFTPFFDYGGHRQKTPGVEVHANALSTLLNEDFIRQVPGWVTFLVTLLLALIAGVTTKKLRPIKALLVIAVVVLGFVLSSFYLFSGNRLWLPVMLPLGTLFLAYIGHVIDLTLVEQRERWRVKKTFQHYVASNVVDQMLESGELPRFGGERLELTVLFSDIRGFTSFSEKRNPEEVVGHLSEYLSSMVDTIFAHQGTLDKFVGDEIMALYGTPLHFDNHAEKACETAVEMVAKLREIQKRWSMAKKDYFQIGIGINTGKMIAGNLGSSQLFDYTVIGDEVNLAARLEGTNKYYSTTIIISESTYDQVKDKAIVRELDLVKVKGKARPVRIYELRGMGSIPQIEEDLVVNVYNQGLTYYKQRKWYPALTEFKRVMRYFPSDGPARVYVKRCLDFLEDPPPEDWDGVYEFTSK